METGGRQPGRGRRRVVAEVQASLFDAGSPELDGSFASAHRVHLDEHSWVEHVPGWLSGAGELLQDLLTTAGWEQRERWMYGERVVEPRLTATYPSLAAAPYPLLHEMGRVLSERYGVEYDGVWVNLYRDHRDSTGWHGDAATCRRADCRVPVLTLGEARRFLVRPVDGGPSTAWRPLSGDLVVMGGRCQRDWRHSVPKQDVPAGPRVSVNFSASAQGVADR